MGVTINIHTGDWVRKGMHVGFKIRPSHPWDGRKYSIFLCEDDQDNIVSYFSHIAFAGAGRDKTLVSLRIKGSEHFVSRPSLVISQSFSLSFCVCVCMCSDSGEWSIDSGFLFLEFKQIMSLVFASVSCL